VTPPVDDVPLKDAFDNLKREFSAKEFTISYTNSSGQMVGVESFLYALSREISLIIYFF
jgi:hypothetical protein